MGSNKRSSVNRNEFKGSFNLHQKGYQERDHYANTRWLSQPKSVKTGHVKARELVGSNPIGNHTKETNQYDKRFLNSQKQARAFGVSQSSAMTQSIHDYRDNDPHYGVVRQTKLNQNPNQPLF